jgi:hypothetical protein
MSWDVAAAYFRMPSAGRMPTAAVLAAMLGIGVAP